MLVTVEFTPDEEQKLAHVMATSGAGDLGTLIKTAVFNWHPPVADPLTAPETPAPTDQPGHDGA